MMDIVNAAHMAEVSSTYIKHPIRSWMAFTMSSIYLRLGLIRLKVTSHYSESLSVLVLYSSDP